MRFNLKNRPKTCFEQELCVADGDLAKWFEGFEKELRERLEKLRNVKGRRSAICRAHEAGEIETIMEILGES